MIGNALRPIGLLYINYIFLATANLDHPLYLKVCSFYHVNIFIVTALTWRIVMTRCCYDTSTDLTPEQRVYIPPHLLHRSSHDIVCQWYTVPCTSSACTVTVCRVISYAPGRALFPPFYSYVSTATLPWAGFLPSFQVNADSVKSLLKPILSSKPISQFPLSLYLAGCRETPCRLYSLILVSA